MEAQIMANIGVCSSFMSSDDAEKTELSVVISPIKLQEDPDTGKVQIISGCNFWRSCHNPDCWYSIKGREKEKIQARERPGS
jgi:hypothetical protein